MRGTLTLNKIKDTVFASGRASKEAFAEAVRVSKISLHDLLKNINQADGEGSPPRMRGTHKSIIGCVLIIRITPAHAGNTKFLMCIRMFSKTKEAPLNISIMRLQ